MNVPFLCLKSTHSHIRAEIDDALRRVVDSQKFILGHELEKFEDEWSAFCDAKFAVGVSNGLDALKLCCEALGIGIGDEVIVPSNTFIATLLAVSSVGATPVPCAPDLRTYNLNSSNIEERITSRTKAIIVVHLYGQPADLSEIHLIAKRNNLFVIEDAAQAHGSSINRRRIGSHSDLVAWSFYPGKNLGAIGDAGAVTTNNHDLAKKISMLRNYGSNERYKHEVLGHNCRMDEVQAAVLSVKLKYLDSWNKTRLDCANYYIKALSPINSQNNNLALNNSEISVPSFVSGTISSWHLFVIRLNKRDELMKYLMSKGIECLIHYPISAFYQGAYEGSQFYKWNDVSVSLSKQIISLPIGPHMNVEMAEQVCCEVLSFMRNQNEEV